MTLYGRRWYCAASELIGSSLIDRIKTMLDLDNKPLSYIAEVIRVNWNNPSPYAVPYIDAMAQIRSINDSYYADTANSVVLYFLANAQGWRGDTARLVKAHLKKAVK